MNISPTAPALATIGINIKRIERNTCFMISIVLLLVILCAKIVNNIGNKKKNERKSTISAKAATVSGIAATVSGGGVNLFRRVCLEDTQLPTYPIMTGRFLERGFRIAEP